MRSIRLPGKLAHTLAVVLTLLLTLMLTLTCLTWQINRSLTDKAMHEGIATDSRVIAMQLERVESRVHQLAEQHFFQPETAMQFITTDTLKAYNQEVVGWWMGLMQAEPVLEAPEWDVSEVEQAVREDALFQENTPANMRRSTARDLVAYEIGVAVKKAVLPVRADLLTMVMPKVLEKIDVPVYMNYLAMAPKLCASAAAVLALLVLLIMLKRVSKGMLYVGAGLAASALCVVGMGLVAYLLNMTGMIAENSTLLATQVSLLTKQIALQSGVYATAALVVGLALIALHQADMRRLSRRRRSAQV